MPTHDSTLEAELQSLREERDLLKADQADWRKGVELIASGLGERDPQDLCCVRLHEVALKLRADMEDLVEERNRLREELEVVTKSAVYWTNECEALAAENAGLREIILEIANLPCVGQGEHDTKRCAACAASRLSELASRSDLVEAVRGVLGAVVDWRQGPSPESAKSDADLVRDLAFAHDHLQALLEGRGEGG